MRTFEEWNRKELKRALADRGWSCDVKPFVNAASQMHKHYLPATVRGQHTIHRTLRNAARISGLIR